MLTKQGTAAAGTAAPRGRRRSIPQPVVTRDSFRNLGRRLVSTGPLARGELLVCFALLTVLAAVVFGSHVRNGGFLMDDWSNAAKSRYLASCCGLGQTGQGLGWASQFHNMLSDGPAGYHLGLPVIIPVVYFLFGIHMGLHLALAAMLGVVMSVAGYALLRKLGMPALHAGVICALVLLFPWSDSTRLWAMASFNQVGVILWLGGVLVTLRGLRRRGPSAIAHHAAALVLYACAVLVYELLAGAVIISAIFYLSRTTWVRAALRGVLDLAVAYEALQYVKVHSLPRPVQPLDAALEHARFVGDQAITLLSFATIPFGTPARGFVDGLLLLMVAVGLAAWGTLPADSPLRATARLWSLTGVGAIVVIVGGYVLIAPATYGAPLDAGIENRVNMIAAFGYVALIYAAAMLLGTLVLARLRRPAGWAVVLPLALSIFMAVGYIRDTRKDASAYDASYAQQQKVLGGIGKAFALHPPKASVTYAFNFASFTAPGIPVYAWVWDMPGAVKMTFQDPSIAAFPILPGTTWHCGKTGGLFPISPYGTGVGEGGPYGNSYFVDVKTGRKRRIRNRADCKSAQKEFQAGPVKDGTDCQLLGGGPATRLAWTCPESGRQ